MDTITGISVLISVYTKEDPVNLDQALSSIIHQTLPPSEIILIKDGPLTPALEEVIQSHKITAPFLKDFSLSKNMGLGNALHFGLGLCSNELVARMDSDDISVKDRLRKQLNFMTSRPEIAVSGGHMEEFLAVPGDLGKIKRVPLLPGEVKRFAALRNPMNHPSVIFRKSAVLSVGSYRDVPLFEDYYLWLRLLQHGYRLENIDDTLLYFRVSKAVQRRRGRGYFKKELFFFRRLRKENLLSNYRFILLIITRLPFRILPPKILAFVYSVFLRDGRFGNKERVAEE